MSTLVHEIRIFFVFYARLHWTSVLQYYRTPISDIFRTIYLSQVNLFSILSFYYNDENIATFFALSTFFFNASLIANFIPNLLLTTTRLTFKCLWSFQRTCTHLNTIDVRFWTICYAGSIDIDVFGVRRKENQENHI